jgi:hypothetical protein
MEKQELTIELIKEPFPHAIIRNFYTEKELSLIWRELDFYTSPEKLMSAIKMGGATDTLTRMPLPKHYGVDLDSIHINRREMSDILTVNRKVFDTSITDTLAKLSPLVWDIKQVDIDFTKIKYYEDGEYYKSHRDQARFTFLTYLYKEPKAFTGGDLYFEEFNYTIPIENNMVVFMKGCIKHASTDIKMTSHIGEKCSGHGKYTITQFCDVKDNLN